MLKKTVAVGCQQVVTKRKRFWQSVMERIYSLHDNSSMDDAIRVSAELINMASSRIYIVSGSLTSDFYESDEIINALAKATDRKVEIEIIVGPKIDKRSTRFLELISKSKKHIRVYHVSERPEIHFMTVDGKHARIEKYHEPYAKDRSTRVRKNTTILARRLETDFRRLKATL